MDDYLRKMVDDPATRLELQIVAESHVGSLGGCYMSVTPAFVRHGWDWDNFMGMRHLIEQDPTTEHPHYLRPRDSE